MKRFLLVSSFVVLTITMHTNAADNNNHPIENVQYTDTDIARIFFTYGTFIKNSNGSLHVYTDKALWLDIARLNTLPVILEQQKLQSPTEITAEIANLKVYIADYKKSLQSATSASAKILWRSEIKRKEERLTFLQICLAPNPEIAPNPAIDLIQQEINRIQNADHNNSLRKRRPYTFDLTKYNAMITTCNNLSNRIKEYQPVANSSCLPVNASLSYITAIMALCDLIANDTHKDSATKHTDLLMFKKFCCDTIKNKIDKCEQERNLCIAQIEARSEKIGPHSQ